MRATESEGIAGLLERAIEMPIIPPPIPSDAELNAALLSFFRVKLVDIAFTAPSAVRIALVPDNLVARQLAGEKPTSQKLRVQVFAGNDGEMARLKAWVPDVIAVVDDIGKAALLSRLNAVWGDARPFPELLFAGDAHQRRIEFEVERRVAGSETRSFAHGYPLVKAHLRDALKHAYDCGAHGPVLELGSFQGGTLLFLEDILRELHGTRCARVIGFDTWSGYPERAMLLDLCRMPAFGDASYRDVLEITKSRAIELVRGDIRETLRPWLDALLPDERVAMAFVDTDNYSAVHSVLPALWKRLHIGGSLVFDHFYTRSDFLNTIGERIAAEEFFFTSRRQDFFHLSGTGVFLKTS